MYENFLHLLVISCSMVIVFASSVVVDSPFGKIRGSKKIDGDSGFSYVTFKGIPYAKPPLGDLRFAKPQPHPKIADTFDATKDDKIICPYPDITTYGETDFTEDCLILNIYAGDSDRTKSLKKVLVFIHGGGFRTGFGRFHDPTSFVISQKVITVTINYRIGILGFLSTENEASPGNYGLWDQTLAIKWVKDNIQAFGGDPDDITIAGESAGGASVGFQILSPHAKGLFTKAYAQSGTATSNFGVSFNAQKHALSVAKSTGCWGRSVDDKMDVKESSSVIDCLRKVPLSAITAFSGYSLVNVQFTPRVDGDFISDLPSKLLRNDEYLDSIGFFDRTYLAGLNNNEAQASDVYLQAIKMVVSLDPGTAEEDREKAVNSYLKLIEKEHMKSRLGETNATDFNVSNEIKSFYKRRFASERGFVEMTTDVAYFLPAVDLLWAASRRDTCKAYLLYFNYFPQFMSGSYTGTPHGGDLLFWFDMEISSLEQIIHAGMQGKMDGEDLQVKQLFSSLIGQFIRTGNHGFATNSNDSCDWPKYDVTNSHYLNFNSKPWVGRFLEKERQDLWFKTVPRLVGTPAMTDSYDCSLNGAPLFTSYCSPIAVFAVFAMLMPSFQF